MLCPSGSLNFNKTRLQHDLETKVEINDEFIASLRRSMGQESQMGKVSKILRSCGEQKKVSRETKVHVAAIKVEDILSSLGGFEHDFITGWKGFGIPLKTKDLRKQELLSKEASIPKHENLTSQQAAKRAGTRQLQRSKPPLKPSFVVQKVKKLT